MSIQPVLIIGAARSGTKFLRDLFGFSTECGVVPYDVNYVWRYRNEDHPNDALPIDLLTRDISDFIRRHLVRLAEPRRREPRVLVEKTVSNGLRVDYLSAVFPEARFIHLVRDGRDVIESALRMWEAPPDSAHLLRKLRRLPFGSYKYAVWYARNLLTGRFSSRRGVRIWGPRYPGIEHDVQSKSLVEVCARQWGESVRRAEACLQKIPPGRRTTVHYEHLVDDETEVRRLCEFAGLGDPDHVLEGYRRTVSRPKEKRWPPPVGPADLARALAVAEPELNQLGYLTQRLAVDASSN